MYLYITGELLRVTTFVTTNRGVILRVNLVKPLAAEVQLFIEYTEVGSGRKKSLTTPNRYPQSDEIFYIDQSVPFESFTVGVALAEGAIKGPLHQDIEMHGR